MEFRLQSLQDEVADLREEVHLLRGAFNRLRRLVESDEGRSVRGARSSVDSYSVVAEEDVVSSLSLAAGSEQRDIQQQPVAPSVAIPVAVVSQIGQEQLPPVLSWADRERICRGIAEFFLRALRGQNRGTSGRDLIPLSSRIWLVARSYAGVEYRPLRVFYRFADCKALVKRGQDCGGSVFSGLPSEKEGRWVASYSGLGWPESSD